MHCIVKRSFSLSVNPVWYKDEHRIHTISELTEMATTIVISTLPPSSPGPNSPATPPEHVEHVTPALFANPPINYQLYSIYTNGAETKTSVLSISQVNNDTKVRNGCPIYAYRLPLSRPQVGLSLLAKTSNFTKFVLLAP